MRFLFIFLCIFSFVFPVYAKDNELVIAFEEWPASFNPALKSGTIVFTLGAQLYAGLTRLDEKGKAIPYLAKKWDIFDDKKKYRFYLHDNAYFHNNTPILADDVVASIYFSKKNHPFHPFLDNITTIQVVNSHIFDIQLKYPMDNFPSLLIPILVPILSKEDIQKEKQYAYKYTGSGPYCLDSYKKNKQIVLKKFDKFFIKDKPKLEKITFKILYDFYEIFYAVKEKDIDLIMFYSPKKILYYLSQENLSSYNIYALDHVYPYMVLTYNMRKNLFQDRRVRKALELAINKKELAEYLKSDFVKAMYGPMPVTHPYYKDIQGEYNPDLANKLLDEAGYKKDNTGKRFSLIINYLAYSYMNDIMLWIQKEWSKNLGIEVIIREKNVYLASENSLFDNNFDLFFDELLLWHDPIIGMYRLYTAKNIDKQNLWTNVGAYQNNKIEQLFNDVLKENNTQKEKQIYYNIQEELANDYASLWLISNMYYVVIQKNVCGIGELPYKMMSPMLDVVNYEKK